MAATDVIDTTQPRGAGAPRRRLDREVYYPTGDGKPLGEEEGHVRETLNCIQSLRFWFRYRQDVYVIGNNFVYWNEGVSKDRVSPDCCVVFGIENRVRPSYKSWGEGGKLPDVVFEFTSKSTMREDINRKLALYGQVWKAQEYFLFDPNRDYLRPPLQGYTLVDGQYVPIELNEGRLHSEQLGLDLEMQGAYLRFFDPAAGEYIPTLAEERRRSSELEAENARLRAEMETLRREHRGQE